MGSKWINEGRPGEKIGGGIIVMRRHRNSKRVSPNGLPYEYGAIGEAVEQAAKLARDNPGHVFEVWERQSQHTFEAKAEE